MSAEHVIADELLRDAQAAFQFGEYWTAYNTIPYFLERGDMYFFRDKGEAYEFSDNNISDHDCYTVIYARSIDELLKQISYGETINQILSNSTNLSTMNEQNFAYLKDNIKYHGFGEDLSTQLEAQLKKGAAEFTLGHKADVNKHAMEATLYFKRSDTTDLYFFNKYDTRLKNERDETVAQTFYINKGQGVTLKEAYNLLNGRAVHKELADKNDQKYQAWIQLDFSTRDKNGNFERKQFHQNYGYDLKEALSYYPIKEMMKEDDRKTLLRSLEKGNVQMVTMETPGKDTRVFIEANPQYKTINVYNNKMQRLDQEKREELMVKPELKEGGKSQDKGKGKKEELAGEGHPEKKQGNGKKKSKDSLNEEDNGLVKKKRERSPGKGMGV